MPSGIYIRTESCNEAHRVAAIKAGVGKFNKGAKRPKLSQVLLGNKRGSGNKGRLNEWMLNERNPNWKGDRVDYRAKHNWVENRRGKPHYCEHCKRSNLPHRSYQWANKSGEYQRIISDWLRLCVTCHKKYDGK